MTEDNECHRIEWDVDSQQWVSGCGVIALAITPHPEKIALGMLSSVS